MNDARRPAGDPPSARDAGDGEARRRDQLLADWRRELRAAGVGGEALDELEAHLRDASEELARAGGLSAIEALLVARERLGDPVALGRELRLAGADGKWARTLRLGLAGYLVVTLGILAAGTLATAAACVALWADAGWRIAADLHIVVRATAILAFVALLARAVQVPGRDGGGGTLARLVERLRAALATRRGTLLAGVGLLACLGLDFAVRSSGVWWFTSRLAADDMRAYVVRVFSGAGVLNLAFWLGVGGWLAWRARRARSGSGVAGQAATGPGAAGPLEKLLTGALVIQLAVQVATVAFQLPLLAVVLARPGFSLLAAVAMETGYVVLVGAMFVTWRTVQRAGRPSARPSPRARRAGQALLRQWTRPLGPVVAAVLLCATRYVMLVPDLTTGLHLPAVEEAWAVGLIEASQVVSLSVAAAWPIVVFAAVARLERSTATA